MDVPKWPNRFVERLSSVLQLRFAPSQFKDPQGAHFKLVQSTKVRDYQIQFQILSNRVSGLFAQLY